jgi:WXG100 family type VII secretion target
MAQAAQRIDQSAGVIKGLQSKLDGHKAQLMSGWAGNASVSFDRVFTEFHSKMGQILQELEGIHVKLVDTRIRYESTEQEQADAVNKINALLNGTT